MPKEDPSRHQVESLLPSISAPHPLGSSKESMPFCMLVQLQPPALCDQDAAGQKLGIYPKWVWSGKGPRPAGGMGEVQQEGAQVQKKGGHPQKNCSKVHEKCPGPKEMERGPKKVFSFFFWRSIPLLHLGFCVAYGSPWSDPGFWNIVDGISMFQDTCAMVKSRIATGLEPPRGVAG